MHNSIAVEVSRTDGNLWGTVIVRLGQHLLFSASHRDVLSALLVDFDGSPSVCVFHGDSLQDLKGRFFLGYKPTLCTCYDVSTAQSTIAALHPTIPHHVNRGVTGVYVFGQRMLAMKSQPQISTRSLTGRPLVPASDAWWMGSGLSLYPVVVPLSLTEEVLYEDNHRVSVPLEARLLKEWITNGVQFCLGITKNDALRLATTEYLVASSAVKLEWQSQPIPFALSAEGAVTVTIAEHSDAFLRQVLFVFSEGSQKIAVYRTSPLELSPQCDLSLELLAILPTSCAAFPIEIFPSCSASCNVIQPIAVVRGWCIELFCCYTISTNCVGVNTTKGTIEGRGELTELDSPVHPFATLQLSSVDLQEGIIDVLSVSQCSIRAISPSMEVRVIDVPSLHVMSHPILKHVFSTLFALGPLLPVHRTYELLHWLVSSLWSVTGDSELASQWTTWNALAERLKCVFVHTLATEEQFENLCSEHRRGTHDQRSQLRSIFEEGLPGDVVDNSSLVNSADRICRFIDPVFITSELFDEPPSTPFNSHVWKHGPSLSSRSEANGEGDSTQKKQSESQWHRRECIALAVGLHLLFESLKIQPAYWSSLSLLGQLLADLFATLGLQQFVRYHTTLLCMSENHTPTMRAFDQNETISDSVSSDEFHEVFGKQCGSLLLNDGVPFDIHAILADVVHGPQHSNHAFACWPSLVQLECSHPIQIATSLLTIFHKTFCVLRAKAPGEFHSTWWSSIVTDIVLHPSLQEAVTQRRLAFGVTQLLLEALQIAKDRADDSWPEDVKQMVGRLDKVHPHASVKHHHCRLGLSRDTKVLRQASERAVGKLYNASLIDDDGVQLDLEFSRRWVDGRLDVAQTMLSTAAPISIPGRGDGTDAIHAALKARSRRVLSLPAGRGMLTLATKNFRALDVIPTPPLVLEGRTSDGILISNEITQSSPETLVWPTFHNGCAAGLRFLPLVGVSSSRDTSGGQPVLSRHWVVYQTRGSHNIPSKGGLLFAAGLLGHLRTLQLTDIYALLASSQTQTNTGQNRARDPLTLAVILGLSCSFRGTHHEVVFRCLSVHLQSLTPTNADLDVSMDVQTGALYAMGLLCQGSGDSFLVDMLLNEMARLPSDEHYKNRRGYSLAAGVSLGLIVLGKGRSGDNGIEDRLLKIMNGAPRDSMRVRTDPVAEFESLMPDEGHFLTRALLHRVSCPVSPPCTKVLEGPQYNVAVSGPGAIMALGLMYIKTNDSLMASRLAPPRTVVGVEGVFPEHCHLRSCLAALVMWNDVQPTREWLFSNISNRVLRIIQNPEEASAAQVTPAQVKYLAMNCGHMLAGSVLALGLRFAGSMSADCRNLILAELNGFVNGKIGSTGVAMNQVQKATNAFESCIASCGVALGLVMAGTGDSASFQVLRRILKKPNATFGSHMSASMSIGLLFLGGGSLTLSNSVSSVAALLIAFYPLWPRDYSDNSDHLQILRHLYVLAAEGRLLQAIDAETNHSLSLQIRVHLSSQRVEREDDMSHQLSSSSRMWTPIPKDNKKQLVVPLTTPCLLPELHTIDSIEVRSSSHYPLVLYGRDLVADSGAITIRVLPRTADRTIHPVDGPSSKLSSSNAKRSLQEPETSMRRVADQLLKDTARMLLKTSLLSPQVAMFTVDNLKLLFQFFDVHHTKLLLSQSGSTHASPLSILSLDLIEQVKRHTTFHYDALLCGSAFKSGKRHPLQLAVNDRLSACDIATSVMHADEDERCSDDSVVDVSPLAELCARLEVVDVASWVKGNANVTRWMSQALHYYSLALPSGSFASSIFWLLDTLRTTEERQKRRVQMMFFAAKQRSAMTLSELEKLANICV